MLLFRGTLAVALILCGGIILARMLPFIRSGFAILPGVVLGAAMIALGIHRLALIAHVRRSA